MVPRGSKSTLARVFGPADDSTWMPVARVRLPYRCKADGFDSIIALEIRHS
jgi:hypothetical protein